MHTMAIRLRPLTPAGAGLWPTTRPQGRLISITTQRGESAVVNTESAGTACGICPYLSRRLMPLCQCAAVMMPSGAPGADTSGIRAFISAVCCSSESRRFHLETTILAASVGWAIAYLHPRSRMVTTLHGKDTHGCQA